MKVCNVDVDDIFQGWYRVSAKYHLSRSRGQTESTSIFFLYQDWYIALLSSTLPGEIKCIFRLCVSVCVQGGSPTGPLHRQNVACTNMNFGRVPASPAFRLYNKTESSMERRGKDEEEPF